MTSPAPPPQRGGASGRPATQASRRWVSLRTGPLFFANADEIRAILTAAVRAPDTRWVVIDLEAVSDIDPSAADVVGPERIFVTNRAAAGANERSR